MINPIKPSAVNKKKRIPDSIIGIFNKCIMAAWDGRAAVVRQSVVLGAIKDQLRISNDEVFDNNWLDVEPCFRSAGWVVEYDKPAYYEMYYDPRFIFTKKKK